MNILITGGAGFIGSEFAKFLLQKNYNVKIRTCRKRANKVNDCSIFNQ